MEAMYMYFAVETNILDENSVMEIPFKLQKLKVVAEFSEAFSTC